MLKLAVIYFTISFASLILSQQPSAPELINSMISNKSKNGNNGTRKSDIGSHEGGDGGKGSGTGQCICVPYYRCDSSSVISNGEGEIDVAFNESPCPDVVDVCCGKEKMSISKPNPSKVKGCGHRNPDGIGFKITNSGANESQYGEFPWMVAILKEEAVQGSPEILNTYKCEGALIHPRVVLTVAHCVSATNTTFKIRAGEWDTQTEKELYPHQDRQVKQVIIHKDYFAGALYNDIALLLLDSPVEIAENVNVVCLPNQDANHDNSRCFVSSWNKDAFGKEGIYQVILKKLDLSIVPSDKCSEKLRQTRLGNNFKLHPSFTCAGGEDTCGGSSGDPLVCPILEQRERFALVGLAAWSIGCSYPSPPGVYVSVAKFRNWIDSQMSLLDIHERPYVFKI